MLGFWTLVGLVADSEWVFLRVIGARRLASRMYNHHLGVGQMTVVPDFLTLQQRWPAARLFHTTDDEVCGYWLTGKGQIPDLHDEKHNIEQIVLPDPDQNPEWLEYWGRALGVRDLAQDIRDMTEEAQKKGITVMWHTQPFSGLALTFCNPKRPNGWLHIDPLVTKRHKDNRPFFRMERKKNRAEFDAIWASYQEILKECRRPGPNPQPIAPPAAVPRISAPPGGEAQEDLRLRVKEWWIACGEDAHFAAMKLYGLARSGIPQNPAVFEGLGYVLDTHVHEPTARAYKRLRDYTQSSTRALEPDLIEDWAFYYAEMIQVVMRVGRHTEGVDFNTENRLDAWRAAHAKLKEKTKDLFGSDAMDPARRALARVAFDESKVPAGSKFKNSPKP